MLTMQNANGPWSRLSSPFSALRSGVAGGVSAGGGATSGPGQRQRSAAAAAGARRQVNGQPIATAAQRQTLAALKSGWTAMMAEKLLELCFKIFFKYGDATLPLLPEMLALHQVRGPQLN